MLTTKAVVSFSFKHRNEITFWNMNLYCNVPHSLPPDIHNFRNSRVHRGRVTHMCMTFNSVLSHGQHSSEIYLQWRSLEATILEEWLDFPFGCLPAFRGRNSVTPSKTAIAEILRSYGSTPKDLGVLGRPAISGRRSSSKFLRNMFYIPYNTCSV